VICWAAGAARVARSAPRLRGTRARVALAIAAACGLGLVVVGLLALASDAGHARDSVILHGFSGLDRRRVDPVIEVTARLSDPLPYACLGLLCVGIALGRRRTYRAVAIGIVLVVSGATAQALKHGLAQPRPADWLLGGQVDDASWPSGHATAAMTLALCAVVAVPQAWRAATALVGAAGAVAVAYATLALAWHYPSDVLAGFLLAALAVSAALAILAPLETDGVDRPGLPPRWWLFAGGAGTAAAAAVVGAASAPVALSGLDRMTVVAGAAAIAGVAVALVVATSVAASWSAG
jgi:membrane-associated phospholipid phosphatase